MRPDPSAGLVTGHAPKYFASPRLARKPGRCALLRFALVEPLLEELPELFARRQEILVARPAGWKVDDPDVGRACPVAARIRSRLVERRKRGAAAEEAHGEEVAGSGDERDVVRAQFAAEMDDLGREVEQREHREHRCRRRVHRQRGP
jgi:hypothetical protein